MKIQDNRKSSRTGFNVQGLADGAIFEWIPTSRVYIKTLNGAVDLITGEFTQYGRIPGPYAVELHNVTMIIENI